MNARLAVAVLGACGVVAQDGLRGTLPELAKWQGQVRLEGDVTVPAGGRLELAPGTVVTVAARDATQAGWHPDRVELHVRGQLLVRGTLDDPVVFVPDDGLERTATTRGTSWHGIVLHEREDGFERRNVIQGGQLFRAFAGVQIPAGTALVENCVFAACSEGMQVGAAYRDERFSGVPGGVADPEIRRCRFLSCRTGIYTQEAARPHVESCVFANGRTGIGSDRPGVGFLQGRPGPRVISCAFVDLEDAVFGCAVVRESWFLRCQRALRLSEYHDGFATHIESVVFEGNLVEDVVEVVVGDSGAARNVMRGPVQPSAPLDAVRQPWPPLPECLRLAADSAGKGKGLGGRDLGPLLTGGVAVVADNRLWEGEVQRGWLAAPVDPPRDGKLERPRPGGRIGASWWAAADAGEQGILHLKGVFGLGGSSGLLALPFTTAAASTVRVPWTGDVQAFECRLDGHVVFRREARSRFGADEPPIEFECPAGRHALVVLVTGWSGDPRWALGAIPGCTLEVPAEAPKVVLRAIGKRNQRTVQIEVTPSVLVHWRLPAGSELVEVRGAAASLQALDCEWSKDGKLRLTMPAAAVRPGELQLVWKGLRDVHGRPLAVEPSSVRVP